MFDLILTSHDLENLENTVMRLKSNFSILTFQ